MKRNDNDQPVGPDSIKLREFRPADVTAVRHLIHHTIDVCYIGVYPPRAVQFFKQFHSDEEVLARGTKGTVLVGEQRGVLVVTGALVGDEILGVFVHPQCHGRGYGKAVMLALEDRAKSNGCTAVNLSVSLPSQAFYQSLGYAVGEACSLEVGEGQRLDFWKASKTLG